MTTDKRKELIKIIEAFLLLWEATEGESDTVNALTDFWQAYTKRNGLGNISADDLLNELETPNGKHHDKNS